MKKSLVPFLGCLMIGLLSGCGNSSSSPSAQAPDPATQPEAQAVLFQRTTDRVKALITSKDYKQAKKTLAVFKDLKLTPEQQKVVDELQAQIPAGN